MTAPSTAAASRWARTASGGTPGCRATSSRCCAATVERHARPDGGRRARRPVADLRAAVGPRPSGRRRPARRRRRTGRPGRRAARQRPRLGARVLGRAARRRRRRPDEHPAVRASRPSTSSPTAAPRYVVRPGEPLPDGEPGDLPDPAAHGRRRALLHERHDRPAQGRDGHPRELPDQRRERHPVPGAAARARPGDADLGAAVPRHRLLLAVHDAARARRDVGDHAAVRPGVLPRAPSPSTASRWLTSVPDHLRAGAAAPGLPDDRRLLRAGPQLRRRPDRAGARAPADGRLPERAAGQRVRAERDGGAGDLPAARVRRSTTPTPSASRRR